MSKEAGGFLIRCARIAVLFALIDYHYSVSPSVRPVDKELLRQLISILQIKVAVVANMSYDEPPDLEME